LAETPFNGQRRWQRVAGPGKVTQVHGDDELFQRELAVLVVVGQVPHLDEGGLRQAGLQEQRFGGLAAQVAAGALVVALEHL